MKKHLNSRRDFIKQTSIGIAATGILSKWYPFASKITSSASEKVQFGFITDLHHGLCKGAIDRLQIFLDEASSKSLDFIMQGGDFCFSEPAAQECVDLWNTYAGEKYHVLGNHDMDKGSKEDIMKLWGMKEKYYSFDKGDFHFVILDGNYIKKDGEYVDYGHANFYIDQEKRSLFSPEQIEWLKQDLAGTEKQTVIISHQALDEIWDGWSSPSRFEIREVIDEANNNFEFQKVIACFCGHHHVDEHSIINDVHYFQMNSASYYWAGKGFGSDGPMAMYTKPLYAFITISPDGKIKIEGKKGDFVSPSPKEKGHPDAPRLSASISSVDTRFEHK
ncbi:metallophosphoesterase family protein [Portibacter lacus]|uniref:Alkaline phosphatase n=1 Tax=Portibacter lacus TaxID=1099794 RepID=A0AA37SRW5_9BACT|nr:metallophosphoesterase [Portibacter lacus]GLR16910.1 alkaline phosphatase [Portibacter lacus]